MKDPIKTESCHATRLEDRLEDRHEDRHEVAREEVTSKAVRAPADAMMARTRTSEALGLFGWLAVGTGISG